MKLIGNLILAILLFLPQIAGAVCVQGDCVNGHGTAVLPEGSRYTGEFREGLRSGRGAMAYPDGTKYAGGWLDDKPHGQGTLISIDRFTFYGEYAKGVRQGQGTLETAAGKRYEGQWWNDAPHGQGRLVDPGGEVYVGRFENGRRSGQGEATYADGSRYMGQWVDNLPNGQGVKTLADGTQYAGDFKDGLMYGSATMILPDGNSIKIHWQNDSPAEKEERLSGEHIAAEEERHDWYMTSSLREVREQQDREVDEDAGRMETSTPELNAVSPETVSSREAGETTAPIGQEPAENVELREQVSPQPPEPEGAEIAEQAQQSAVDEKIRPQEAENEPAADVMPLEEGEASGPEKGYAPYSATTSGDTYARISVGANIRSGPALTAEVLRTVPAGYPVAVLEQRDDWVLVQDFRERKGWVYASLLAAPETVIVKVFKANLRSGPGFTDDVIVQLDHGTVVTVAETRNDWLRVHDSGNLTGWLHRKVIWP